MTVVSDAELTRAMQALARQRTAEAGLGPQAQDRPLDGSDLLFYLSATTMPMADFLQAHGLYVDGDGLHYDLSQFGVIRQTAEQVIAERAAGDTNGLWRSSIFPPMRTPTRMVDIFSPHSPHWGYSSVHRHSGAGDALPGEADAVSHRLDHRAGRHPYRGDRPGSPQQRHHRLRPHRLDPADRLSARGGDRRIYSARRAVDRAALSAPGRQ